MAWLKETFSDQNGNASFKRQASFLLVLACIIGVYNKLDVTPIALLAGTILGSTALEKFSDKK